MPGRRKHKTRQVQVQGGKKQRRGPSEETEDTGGSEEEGNGNGNLTIMPDRRQKKTQRVQGGKNQRRGPSETDVTELGGGGDRYY